MKSEGKRFLTPLYLEDYTLCTQASNPVSKNLMLRLYSLCFSWASARQSYLAAVMAGKSGNRGRPWVLKPTELDVRFKVKYVNATFSISI